MKRIRVVRHNIGFILLHWTIFVEGVILTLTGLQLGGIFGFKILGEAVWATHVVVGLLLTATIGFFIYYLIITSDYKWYGLRRIPCSIRFLIMETKAWFGGPYVEEPIRYDPKRKKYVEKVIPTVITVWWIYAILGLILIITGLAMVFPAQFSPLYTVAEAISPLMNAGGYSLLRALHRLAMFVLVGVVVLHVYAAWVFKMLRSITFGYRDEPTVSKVAVRTST